MYTFHRYFNEDLHVILSRRTVVQVCSLWGYTRDNYPGPMMDFKITLDNPMTVSEAADLLAAKYARRCEDEGWTPREAYGYEGIRRVVAVEGKPGVVEVMLGT